MNKDKIFVVIRENKIIISYDGKKLVVDKDNNIYKELKSKTKDEIKEWYLQK